MTYTMGTGGGGGGGSTYGGGGGLGEGGGGEGGTGGVGGTGGPATHAQSRRWLASVGDTPHDAAVAEYLQEPSSRHMYGMPQLAVCGILFGHLVAYLPRRLGRRFQRW